MFVFFFLLSFSSIVFHFEFESQTACSRPNLRQLSKYNTHTQELLYLAIQAVTHKIY